MTHNVDDLLQARLDGELTAVELEELARLEREDPAIRARAAALASLEAWIDTAGAVTAPAGMVKSVMSRVRPRVLEFRRPTPAGAVGGSEMKKAMIGVAAAAVLVFAYFAVNGFPPADNAQGAIGAAKRYNAEQMTGNDVQVGDTAVQNFIQSDTFARLVKNPDAVKLLQDAAFRENLARLSGLTKSGALHDALNDADFRDALTRENLGRALSDSAVNRYLKDPAFAKELRDAGLSRGLAGKELAGSKLAGELAGKYPLLGSALKDQAFADAFNKYDLGSALKDAGFRDALANSELVDALSNPAFEAAFNNPGFEAALKDAGFVDALQDAAFADALTRAGFGQALDAALKGGLKGDLKGGLENELKGDLTRSGVQR